MMNAGWIVARGGIVCIERLLPILLAFALFQQAIAVELPPPPHARVQSVAGSSSALGMRLEVRRFSADQTVEQVLDFYRGEWERYNEVDLPPWRMIGRVEGEHYLNVQVQPDGDGGSWGYLSIGNLPGRLADGRQGVNLDRTRFPMMSGSTLINDQVDDDPGKTGRTLLISNNFSAGANRTYYRNHFRSQGWRELMDQAVNPSRGEYALFYQRGNQTVALTIQRVKDATVVVANHVERGLLR